MRLFTREHFGTLERWAMLKVPVRPCHGPARATLAMVYYGVGLSVAHPPKFRQPTKSSQIFRSIHTSPW